MKNSLVLAPLFGSYDTKDPLVLAFIAGRQSSAVFDATLARSTTPNPGSAWVLVSTHGAILLFVGVNPGVTAAEIAGTLSIGATRARRLIGELCSAGMLHVRRDGQRRRYTVNLNANFQHPVLKEGALRRVLGSIADGSGNDEGGKSRFDGKSAPAAGESRPEDARVR